MIKAILFDFDGVIVDSETVANQALADALTTIGLPTSLEESLALYCGWRWSDCLIKIEARLGKPMPADFPSFVERVSNDAVMAQLAPVGGCAEFLARTRHVPRAVASSSPLSYLETVSERLGFTEHFEGFYFSADQLPHGKPHPQVYLNAAAGLGVDLSDCLVIEDSPLGVQAGVAAGARVIGLCAGSHIRVGHGERLSEAGAHQIAHSYGEIIL
jgi:HAD superfamily hydrolase (TIGR01509 family)